MQFLSEKMCRHLSSLAPGFEGHWAYVESSIDGKTQVVCAFKRYSWRWANDYKFICPAWQVEDVLRNLHTILPVEKKIEIQWLPGGANPYAFVSEEICKLLRIKDQDTAYQKIEEYLWEILGHSRTEECTGAHCKCMQNDCANHHYNDHKK